MVGYFFVVYLFFKTNLKIMMKKEFNFGDWIYKYDGKNIGVCEQILEPIVNNQVITTLGVYSINFEFDRVWRHATSEEINKVVDMNKIQEQCKIKYPIGCKFKHPNGEIFILKQDNTVYNIYGYHVYAHNGAGSLYNNGRWTELVPLPETDSIKSIDEYFPDLSRHIGRYVKLLTYAPHGGYLEVGEYGKIRDKSNIDFPNHTGYSANNALDEGYLNKHYELMPEGFEPLSEEKSCELDLIKEAQRRYPIGTKFHPAHMIKGYEFCIITNTKFKLSDNGNGIEAMTDYNKSCDFSNDDRYGNTCFFRYVYHKGKWAEYYVEPTITPCGENKLPDVNKVFNSKSYPTASFNKEDIKTSISHVSSVDIRLTKKKKKILF